MRSDRSLTRCELARQRRHGAARGGFRGGVDEVGHGLGLSQVEALVEKGAAGELAGFGRTQSEVVARLQAARQDAAQHGGAAMSLQLQYVFAGIGVRSTEVDGEPFVDHLAVGGAKRQVVRVARRQRTPEQPLCKFGEIGPGYAHHADAPAAGAVAIAAMGAYRDMASICVKVRTIREYNCCAARCLLVNVGRWS